MNTQVQAPSPNVYDWRIVAVRFNSLGKQQTYDYRTYMDFVSGDSAVVEVNGNLKVVDIMEVRSSGDPATTINERDLKWIVDKVDTGPYLARLAEEQAVEREMAEIMAEAERRRVQQGVKSALSDPDLVARYESLLVRQANL